MYTGFKPATGYNVIIIIIMIKRGVVGCLAVYACVVSTGRRKTLIPQRSRHILSVRRALSSLNS